MSVERRNLKKVYIVDSGGTPRLALVAAKDHERVVEGLRQAQELLKPLADCDPAIRAWLKEFGV